MNKKIFDLAVVTGKYTVNGQEKNRYENVGTEYEREDGKHFIMFKAHFNPAAIQRKDGSDRIVISCFEPKQKDNNSSYQHQDFNEQDNFDNYNDSDELPPF